MGFYNDKLAAPCKPCPLGQISPVGAVKCTNPCKAGTYNKDGLCVQCSAGYYSNTENASNCSPCAPGTESDGGKKGIGVICYIYCVLRI